MTQALRSPGSALKPFIYGLGFEDGLIHPETLIDDRPIRYGSYAPENFDLSFQGTVTVRRALQLSLNVPAVAVLDRVGASRFTARLGAGRRRAGAAARRSAGTGDGARRRRRDAQRSGHALCRRRAARQHHRADRAHGRRRRAAAAAPADGAGRGLVSRQRDARHAAAGERRRRPHRVQDRHLLRLSRRLGGRLRRQAHHRRLGRAAGRRAGAGPDRPQRRGADPVRRLRPHRQPAGGACRRRRAGRWWPRPAACRRRCSGSGRTAWRARAADTQVRIMFPPNGARLELASSRRRPARADRPEAHRRDRAADRAGQRHAGGCARPGGATRCFSSRKGRDLSA